MINLLFLHVYFSALECQTKKAIENAFVRWNAMLLRYIQNEDANAFKRLMDDLNLMIPSFSRVLGGGRKNV
jgi:hypothetical protein